MVAIHHPARSLTAQGECSQRTAFGFAMKTLVSLLTVSFAFAGSPDIRNAVQGPVISRTLVGNNVWMNPDEKVWSITAEAGLKMIRIGGIAYDNHLPSLEQLTQWVNKIKEIGAEPMIQVSSRGTAEEAAAVVRYFNIETKNRVIFWNIGNEPWIERGRPDDRTSLAPVIAAYVKAAASAMKDADPTIRIYAPDECDYFDGMYEALVGGKDDITGKDARGRYCVDGISWHRYVGYAPENIQINELTTRGVEDFRTRMEKVQKRVEFANQLHGRKGDDALQWGLGEFNSNDGPRVCTFENGQMMGLVYGDLMKYGGVYGTLWSMFEHSGDCRGTDFSFIGGDMKPRPIFYHMQMISQNMCGNYVDGKSSNPAIRAFAGIDKDKIAVMVFNIDTTGRPIKCTIRLDEKTIDAAFCQINVAAGADETIDQIIECQTTMMFIFNRKGKLQKRITYSKGSWRISLPPAVEVINPN